jgi:hypothetical protein
MAPNPALADILEALSTSEGDTYFNWDTTSEWNNSTLTSLLDIKLLTVTTKAKSLTCSACHYECFEEVIYTADLNKANNRAFIVCGEPEMQTQMGRITLPFERLQRWKSSTLHLAKVIAAYLELDPLEVTGARTTQIRIGMLKTKQGRRQLSLVKHPLELEINQRRIPINEVLLFEHGKLIFDRSQIDTAGKAKALPKGKPYVPATNKREINKLNIQLRNQSWREECKRLKVLHPLKSKTWIADRIAESDIAQGKSSETIRKHMKN